MNPHSYFKRNRGNFDQEIKRIDIMELRSAVLSNDLERVKILLDQGADPNFKDPTDQCAALHFAAALGNIDILTTLLQNVREKSSLFFLL